MSRVSKKKSAGCDEAAKLAESQATKFIDLSVDEPRIVDAAPVRKEKDSNYHNFVDISFSLVDKDTFTTQCVTCRSRDRMSEILTTYQLAPNAKFDWTSRPPRWLFPITYHDQLWAILEKMHNVKVEPLPKRVLQEFKRDDATDIVTAHTGASEVGDSMERGKGVKLEDHLPGSVLDMLAPFQREGVEFVIRAGGRSLIADDMGLGKTRTAVASALVYQQNWPVLIVCPAVAKNHWYAELENVLVTTGCINQRDILVIDNASQELIAPGKKRTPCKFVVMSYTVVKNMMSKLNAVRFGVVITDECHYLKNSKAIRTQVLVPMLQKAKRAFMISGTPALSRPIELFTQLNALDKLSWPDERAFGQRYCRSSTSSGRVETFRGARNCRELHTILTSEHGLMIRRLKVDILTQLPHKKRHVVRLRITDSETERDLAAIVRSVKGGSDSGASTGAGKKRKTSAETAAVAPTTTDDARTEEHARSNSIDVGDVKAENMAQLLQLFSRSGMAKVGAFFKHLDRHLDDPDSGKLLVFAHHTPVMDAIEAYLSARGEELVRIDGQTHSADRFANTRHFQTQKSCRVALLAITAAGVGITLTAASKVFFCEMFWTPGSLIQAEDRAHRMGQEREVTVTYFLADNSIDDILWPLLISKVRTLGEIVEGSGSQDFEVHQTTDSSGHVTVGKDAMAASGGVNGLGGGAAGGRKRRGSSVVSVAESVASSSSSGSSTAGGSSNNEMKAQKIVDLNALEGIVKDLAVNSIKEEGNQAGADATGGAKKGKGSRLKKEDGLEDEDSAESIVQSHMDANAGIEVETSVDVIANQFAKLNRHLHVPEDGVVVVAPTTSKPAARGKKTPKPTDLTTLSAAVARGPPHSYGDENFSYADALDRQLLFLNALLAAEGSKK
jgi:SWI/SNF-related matrix-associated actin-dependent regulator of chromatin subfamily A-like protein 1